MIQRVREEEKRKERDGGEQICADSLFRPATKPLRTHSGYPREYSRAGTTRGHRKAVDLVTMGSSSLSLSLFPLPLLLSSRAFHTRVAGNRFAYRRAPRIVLKFFIARLDEADDSRTVVAVPCDLTVLFPNGTLFSSCSAFALTNDSIIETYIFRSSTRTLKIIIVNVALLHFSVIRKISMLFSL